ncbi:MAG: hypothetical protein D6762_01360 [Candidatus Neomarinimicrobiota bacterium]|nr:MAG: hypothetical protein D6762_01360 [Candidatus Neomarinimicrobiota bacterium]
MVVHQGDIDLALTTEGFTVGGCRTDSCLKRVADLLEASHVLAWSLTEGSAVDTVPGTTGKRSEGQVSASHYDLTVRMKYFDASGAQLQLLNDVQWNYTGDANGLEAEIRKAVWTVLSRKPPPGRFPEQEVVLVPETKPHRPERKRTARKLEFAGATLVSIGAVYAILQMESEQKPPQPGIGYPPDWPKP